MNSLKLLIMLMIMLVLGSCQKLDQEPQATASYDAIFSSESGLQMYSYSFYDMLPSANDIVQGDELSDYGARAQVHSFLNGNYNALQNAGEWDWENLRNVNFFIANCNDPGLSEEVKNNYIGIARFFRAWFYFDMLKEFGDVPWVGDAFEPDDERLYNGRDSRVLVVDSMLADLDFAAENISNTSDDSRTLITQDIVQAFKSRVCLFEGTFRKYHTAYELATSAPELFSLATDAAEAVMNSGRFSLNATGDEPYRNLFISDAPNASEIMLAVAMSDDLSIWHTANWWLTSPTYGVRLNLIRTFVNTYLNIDGTAFTNTPNYATQTFMEEVQGRDGRLQQTIRAGDYTRINNGLEVLTAPSFSYTYTGYQPVKWVLDNVALDNVGQNTNAVSLIRYAEVLLNYAEAKAELGELSATDWNNTIGALRRRAGITGNTGSLPTVADPYLREHYFPGISDPILLEVRRERGVELVFEGFRFHDIVRWAEGHLMEMTWNGMYVPELGVTMDLNEDGIPDVRFYQGQPAPAAIAGVVDIDVSTATTRLSEGTSGEINWLYDASRVWDDKYYLYPIPNADLVVNPALRQNPGW